MPVEIDNWIPLEERIAVPRFELDYPKGLVRDLYRSGYGQREIAGELGMRPGSIHHIIRGVVRDEQGDHLTRIFDSRRGWQLDDGISFIKSAFQGAGVQELSLSFHHYPGTVEKVLDALRKHGYGIPRLAGETSGETKWTKTEQFALKLRNAQTDQEIQEILNRICRGQVLELARGNEPLLTYYSKLSRLAGLHLRGQEIHTVVVPAIERAHIPHTSIPASKPEGREGHLQSSYIISKKHERRAIKVFSRDPFLIRLGLPPKERKIPLTEMCRRGLIRPHTLIRYTSSLRAFLLEHDIDVASSSVADLYEGIVDNPSVIKLPQGKKGRSKDQFAYRVDTSSPLTQRLLIQITDRRASEQQISKRKARLVKLAPYIDMLDPERAWVLRQRLAGIKFPDMVNLDPDRRKETNLRQLASKGMRELEGYLPEEAFIGKSG